MDRENRLWLNQTLIIGAAISFLLKVGSILGLIRIGFEYCFIAVISILVEWFLSTVNAIFANLVNPWLLPLLRGFSEFFGYDLEPYTHWHVIFVIMMLKSGSDVFAELNRKDYFYAVLWLGWGLIINATASLISGLVPLDDPSMIPIIAPIMGFVIYGSGQAIWLALYRIPEGKSGWQIFRYYFLRFAVADGIIGALCLIAAIVMRNSGYPSPNVLAFFLYLFGMACRDLALPAWYVTFTKLDGGTWRRRYMRLATTWTGLNTMATLFAVLLVMIGDAGLANFTGANPCQ